MSLPSFDALATLYNRDPVAFEKLRAELIEEEISKAPTDKQPRLRGIQFRIDVIRKTSRTPLACCVAIQNMLHNKVGELLAVLSDGRHPALPTHYQNNVLRFPDKDGA